MTSEFKEGRLVAVSDCGGEGGWHLRVYVRASSSGHHFCRRLEAPFGPSVWWKHAKPAEEVWPGIFIGGERSAREQSDHAVEMESELVQRLRKQINWLCEHLQDINADLTGHPYCPSDESSCDGMSGCAECWERASREAVKEGADGKRDS